MSELLRSINPGLASLLYPARAGRSVARPRPAAPYVDEEEEKSMIGSLRDKSLTMVGALGNALDLPGSMVRDTIALKNPLDQLLTPLSGDNRTSGRDLARQFGVAGGRKTWGNAIGGFATEVALDPLTYMSLGGSALGKAGQAASKLGLMDDVGRVAARKAGVESGKIGKRQARNTTTLSDILQFGDDAAKVKAQRAIGEGAKPTEQLGGLVGFGLPFMQPSAVAGTGAIAQKIAKGMDTVGRTARFAKVPGTEFSPINSVLNLFDAPAMDTKTPWGQAIAKEHANSKGLARSGPRQDFAEAANALSAAGMTGEKYSDAIRLGLEGVAPVAGLPAVVRPFIDKARKQSAEMLPESRKRGLGLEELTDDHVDYAARYLTRDSKHAPKRSSQNVSAYDPSEEARLDFLRNVPGGTVNIKNLVKDQDIGALIDSGASVDDVAKKIEAKAGGWLPDMFKKFDKDGTAPVNPGDPDTRWVERQGRYKAIAEWMGKLTPETRATGVFGNHPLLDHQARRISFEEAVRGSETVAKALAEPGILKPPSSAANAAADGSVSVQDMLNKLSLTAGDEKEGFLQFLRKQMGPQAAGMKVEDMKNMRIDAKYAEDLGHVHKAVSGPDAVNDIMQFVDSITNFSKGMWTSVWPAFHARNIVSGQIQNAMLGMWDKESAKWAHDIQRGKVLTGASKLPIVREEWAKRGSAAPLTDEEATKILGELAYAHELIGKHDAARATDVSGVANTMHAGNLNEALTGIPRPGLDNFSPARVINKAIGRQEGTNLKPWEVRGVGDRLESGFGPAAAGEEIGFYSEGLNRLAPFFNLLKKGYDPAEAAKRVGAAQVIYNNRNYTPAELAYFTRLFPFYKFSRSQIPFHVKHLMEKPGGGYAQVTRAMNNAQSQGELAPEYVRDTASIPVDGSNPILSKLIGQAPAGTDRYIAGFGLMNEDMLSVGPGLKGTFQEALSRTNPFIKGPLEYAANQTFFQAGPEGGRDLDKLDPTIGRLLANVTGREDPVKLPAVFEQVMSNSPAARLLTTARSLTDTRKQSDYGGSLPFKIPGPAALINVLTGGRITDVSPGAKDAIVRDLLTGAMKDGGASTFERVYFPKAELAKMQPEERDLAVKLQGLANVLAQRSKQRKAEKEAKQ